MTEILIYTKVEVVLQLTEQAYSNEKNQIFLNPN